MEITSAFSLSAPPYPGPAALLFSRLGIYKYRGQTFISRRGCSCVIYPSRVWSNPITGDGLLYETINHEALHAAIYASGYDLSEIADHNAIRQLLFDEPSVVRTALQVGKVGFFFFQGGSILFGLALALLFTALVENPIRYYKQRKPST